MNRRELDFSGASAAALALASCAGRNPTIDKMVAKGRALYIFQDGQDTLYRVHGSQEASSIGRAVSSGCVRLLNQDVIDLYDRVPNGSNIVVV